MTKKLSLRSKKHFSYQNLQVTAELSVSAVLKQFFEVDKNLSFKPKSIFLIKIGNTLVMKLFGCFEAILMKMSKNL